MNHIVVEYTKASPPSPMSHTNTADVSRLIEKSPIFEGIRHLSFVVHPQWNYTTMMYTGRAWYTKNASRKVATPCALPCDLSPDQCCQTPLLYIHIYGRWGQDAIFKVYGIHTFSQNRGPKISTWNGFLSMAWELSRCRGTHAQYDWTFCTGNGGEGER